MMPERPAIAVTSHWTIGHEADIADVFPKVSCRRAQPRSILRQAQQRQYTRTTSVTVKEQTERTELPADQIMAENENTRSKADVWIVATATVILSFTVVATAWCSYQSTLWGGIQAASYNSAGGLRVKATRAMTTAGQLQIIDVGVFLRWVASYAEGDSLESTFLRRSFRPEFRPAFDAWLASRPLKNPNAASTPFALPEYRIALYDSSQYYESEAVRLFDEGQRANQIGDRYVLDTVLFALALFFASSAQQGKRSRIRITTLALSLVITVVAVGDMLAHPRP